MSDVFILYGASISLYTGKARAYLRFRNVPFIEKSITPEVIQKIGYFMIPVLETPEGDLIQDTTEIIDYLEERFPGPSVYPKDPLVKFCALLLEVYGDEWLVIPAMHYRWKYNAEYILREFGKNVAPQATPDEQFKAGEKAAAGFRGSLPLLGITPENETSIESWYEELLQHLDEHLENREYMFGSRPSIGDFGLMGPLYAHNYRDPWSGELMRKLAPNLVRWVDMMNTPAPNTGTFESDIAATLAPLVKRIFKEFVPAMINTIEVLASWLDENPGVDIPRSIGTFKISIGESSTERNIFPFNQWMFQRPLSYYQSLEGHHRDLIDNYLREVGGFGLMQTKLQYRLARENYQLKVCD